jgi:hypothetical protein
MEPAPFSRWSGEAGDAEFALVSDAALVASAQTVCVKCRERIAFCMLSRVRWRWPVRVIDVFYQPKEIFDLLQHDVMRTLPILEK